MYPLKTIHAIAPIRINDIGGWTDTWFAQRGKVLNMAVFPLVEVRIQVLETKTGQVKLGIDAPGHITIHREEIYQRIVEENKKAAMETPVDLASLEDIFPPNT